MAIVTLDFPGAGRQQFRQPHRILEARVVGDVATAIRQVEAETARGAWAAGFIAYEAAPAFDRALVTRPAEGPLPLLWFGIFHGPEAAAQASPPDATDTPPAPALPWRTPTPREEYDAAVAEIRRRIAAGDVYQVNHTLRFGAPWDGDAAAMYDALVAARHGRYHAFIGCDEWAVVSASPELFFDLAAPAPDGRLITTRPMKGTARRGRWLEEDRAAAGGLAASPKDRAENLMIVDLLRNDLGRIARFGTVRVPQLFQVESYPTVHQLTSTITAELREDVGLGDVFAATFPCGSVTGAPKVTAMRAIAELEDAPRGPYCGAVGVVRPDGSATFNVAIRTLALDRRAGTAVYGAGGGITWDSRADAEYDEAVAKAAMLTEPVPSFRLLETMRMDDGVVPRLQRHLQRLRASAAYWGFEGDVAATAAEAVATFAAAHLTGSYRLRLTVGRDEAGNAGGGVMEHRAGGAGLRAESRVALEHRAAGGAARSLADADVAEPCRVAIARTAVFAGDRLLCHKTTARAAYESRRAAFPDAFDVLLFNHEGMVTEFTFGNLVALLDGRLVTPPREHGLLAGTLRAELLDAGTVVEAPLPLAELRRASRLYHVNSVRGATRVVLTG